MAPFFYIFTNLFCSQSSSQTNVSKHIACYLFSSNNLTQMPKGVLCCGNRIQYHLLQYMIYHRALLFLNAYTFVSKL